MEPEEIARYMDAYRKIVRYVGNSGSVVLNISVDEAKVLGNNIVMYRKSVPLEIQKCVKKRDSINSLEKGCKRIISEGGISSS